MKCSKRLSMAAMALLLLAAVACVPSQTPETAPAQAEPAAPPEEAVAPEAAPEAAPASAPEAAPEAVPMEPEEPVEEPAAEVTPATPDTSANDPYMPTIAGPTSNMGENGLLLPTTPEAQQAAYKVEVTSLSPEEGGPGADVEGAFHLHATLRPKGEGSNQWEFKGELTFPSGGYTLGEISHDQMGPGQNGNPAYIIFIPVALPPVDAVTTQALDKRALEYTFEGPEDISFVVSYAQL